MPEKKHISFSLVCVQTIKLEQSEFLTFAGKHSAGTLLFFTHGGPTQENTKHVIIY